MLLRTDTVLAQCISYIKNYPKTSGSKQHTLFHDFCGSETLEKLSWTLSFRVFHKVAIKLLPVISSEGSVGERPASKPFPQVVGRIQFLKGCWTEVISFLLTTAQRPPSASCHMGLSKITTCFIKTSCGKSAYKTKILTFNLRIETSSLCHILFITSKSLDSAHTQGKGVTYGHGCQKVETTGGHLRRLPTAHSMTISLNICCYN